MKRGGWKWKQQGGFWKMPVVWRLLDTIVTVLHLSKQTEKCELGLGHTLALEQTTRKGTQSRHASGREKPSALARSRHARAHQQQARVMMKTGQQLAAAHQHADVMHGRGGTSSPKRTDRLKSAAAAAARRSNEKGKEKEKKNKNQSFL